MNHEPKTMNQKLSTTTAIILAGGFGTRLQSVVSEVPKPMAPVAGIPFLSYFAGLPLSARHTKSGFVCWIQT